MDVDNLSEKMFSSTENKVFDNPLLLEEILKYLLLYTNIKSSRKTVQTVRPVRKSWLESTTAILRKSRKPIIKITLDEKNSLTESATVMKNGKHLDRFVSTFDTSSRLQYSQIPFKLVLIVGYFREENQQSLSDCFARLGNDLTEIELMFPKDGGTMPLTFPRFTLPCLKTLKFIFSQKTLQARLSEQESPAFGNNRNGLGLLQLLLNASEHTQEVYIRWSGAIKINFEFIQLPNTILSLEFIAHLESKNMNMIFKNPLPCLKRLVVRKPKRQEENDVLSKILNKFRKTLIDFETVGTGGIGSRVRSATTNLKFPVMENLETIKLTCTKIGGEPENSICLPSLFPKLKSVTLIHQSEVLLEEWTQNSKFETVKALAVCLVNDEFSSEHPNYYRSISLEIIEQLHISFPNVLILTLTLKISDLSSLKYIFKNMKQLECFNIILQGKFQNRNQNQLVSALLGIPVALVAALTEYSNFVNPVDLKNDPEQSSIVNLSELKLLSLCVTEFPFLDCPVEVENEMMSIIPDMLFNKLFLQLPKLETFQIFGNLQASTKMVDLWNRQGRRIQRWSPLQGQSL